MMQNYRFFRLCLKRYLGGDLNNTNNATEGWAILKKERPDMYRTPVMEQRTGQGGIWGRANIPKAKANQPFRMETFPNLFLPTFPSNPNQHQMKGNINYNCYGKICNIFLGYNLVERFN